METVLGTNFLQIAVDASNAATITIARVDGRGTLERRRCYPTAGVKTFTDTILRYQRDEAIDLRGAKVVVAVSGAPARDNFQIARTRWTISRQGLASIFGAPPLIINDVVAKAWAVRGNEAQSENLRSDSKLVMSARSRFVLINVDEGVGAAVIDIDNQGTTRVLDTEAGHCDFAPANDWDSALAMLCRRGGEQPSWEAVLLADRKGRVRSLLLEADEYDRFGEILGRMTYNLILSSGAWRGAILSGKGVNHLLANHGKRGFLRSFDRGHAMRRLMAGTSCWRIDQEEPVLRGCAAVFAEQMKETNALDPSGQRPSQGTEFLV